jgi:adenine-specific DNA-methyltransferase
LRGFVPTPPAVVDSMVAKLFAGNPPGPESVVLDPGCGNGRFIDGVVRWARQHGQALPRILGVESDPKHVAQAKQRFGHLPRVRILNEDFLAHRDQKFEYIIGNPPYVPITALSPAERNDYRGRYDTAVGRFDLYLLFFEQSLRLLKPGGRLVFITPEKFLYVRTATPLRKALAKLAVEETEFLAEKTFEHLTTYPIITTVTNAPVSTQTKVLLRDGTMIEVRLPSDGSSWLPGVNGTSSLEPVNRLTDVCLRVSCGVATGADSVFVMKTSELPSALRPYAYPTVAGREISIDRGLSTSHSMLVPYAKTGQLLSEDQLGELGSYLRQGDRQNRLLQRTCVSRKPWYAFHENPPLPEILRPKILCKDITAQPFFIVDTCEETVPRHSVYYIVPKDPESIWELCAYLNSAPAQAWLRAHCQRAANGFLRLQSHVLKNLPVSADLVRGSQLAWYGDEAALI